MKGRWKGETVTCIASGPGSTAIDAEVAARFGRTIVVNESWRLLPRADVLYAADAAWWKLSAPPAGAFTGERWTCGKGWKDSYPAGMGVASIKIGVGMSLDYPMWSGWNSGFQALQLAAIWGARRVILLGYEMMNDHWHEPHKNGLNNVGSKTMAVYRQAMDNVAPLYAAAGIEVLNASRQTALTAYKRASLDEIF